MTTEGADLALVKAARAGSSVAFGRLVDAHQQAVRAFLRRVLGDWNDADDLAQETFLTAWSLLGRLGKAESVRAWLCGIAYRKALTHMRSRGRALRRDGDFQAAEAFESTTGASAEDRIAVDRALAALPPDQWAATALCLAADFSHAEAAEALGLPLGTVKSHVTRGRARLLQALGGEDGER